MRIYKKVSIDPSKVRKQQVSMLPPQIIGGKQMVQFVTSEQTEQYAITLITNDRRTFDRLMARL